MDSNVNWMGPIPDEKVLDHLGANPCDVSKRHLEVIFVENEDEVPDVITEEEYNEHCQNLLVKSYMDTIPDFREEM